MALVKKEMTSQKAWDDFVLTHAPRALFQSFRWGEVEEKLGHAIWRWGWFKKDVLVGVAQIKKVTARRGTFLHVRHGPIGDVAFEDIVGLAKKEGALFIRVSPQLPEGAYAKKKGFVSAPIHAMDAEVCWVLDLDKSEDERLANMRKTTRYEIRRAQKLGVTVTKGHDVTEFLHLYDETSNRHNFVQHKGIREEVDMLDTDVFLASHEGKAIAAAVILYFGDEAIYHHGASVTGKIPASYLVQWEAIREAKRRGKKVYNFWGIAPTDNTNHPWRGLTVFKTGFGGHEVRFMHAVDYPVSPFYVIPRVIEGVRRRLKGY